MARIRDRLLARAAERFVGRDAELELIGQSLAAESPPVSVFIVHGPGGVGKTTLLERARVLAASHGVDSLRLDARDIEPTPDGVLRALGAALGLPAADAALHAVIERWSSAGRRMLVIDTFEHLAHLEAWLRQALFAEFPEQSIALIASRTNPDPAWTTDPLWREGARVLSLRNLTRDEGRRYLRARAVAARHHERALDLSYGHPLALTMLADIIEATGDVPETLDTDIVRRLAERFTAQAPTDLHRRALEVSAHARITTEALLADAADPGRARELFEWLASLSFIEASPAGLFPHDLVRDAIDGELYWRHRQRYLEVHQAVRGHLLGQIMVDVSRAPMAVFDLLFLHRRVPLMQRFVDFHALGSAYFERMRPFDLPALRALIDAELSAPQRARLERWLEHPAAAVWLARPAPSLVTGVTLTIDLARLSAAERAADPVAQAVWRALPRAAPPRDGDMQALARWTVPVGGQRTPSSALNALQMAQFFQWITLPRLGAFVIAVEWPDHWLQFMDYIGFRRMAECDLDVDGVALGCYLHDWRAEPLPQWLARMGAREVGSVTAAEEPQRTPGNLLRLTRDDFDRAVRDALRMTAERVPLKSSPLLSTACVAAVRLDDEPGETALRRLLHEAAESLRERPREQKFWRALEATYFRPAGTQELAAERLGLPFGTYRYQLAIGVERIADALWRRELDASG